MTNRTKGIIAIIISAFGFALMAMFVRLCDDFGNEISSFQKSFFRNIIAFAIAAVVFARAGRSEYPLRQTLNAKTTLFLFIRCLAGCIGIFANFYALSKIPIAEAMALNKTAPFFTVLFSWILLKESPKMRQLLAILIAFAGVTMVMKPLFVVNDAFAFNCALIGGLGAGIAYTCVRELGVHKVNPAFIVLFFSAFSSLASIPFIITGFTPMTMAQIFIMLGAGAGAAIGQFGITAAYRFAPPRQVAVYDYTNLIFTAILGFMLFDQIPDWISITGFITIIAAGIFANSGVKK
ncbi:MAG: DMT family transporter [Kiritimatiellae bacterium]|nr:DMT family transporter [Kiritimatiellia bacterium]